MRKYLVIVAIVAVLVLAFYIIFWGLEKRPRYFVEDFTNEDRIFYSPDLPREELDLRAQELAQDELPREDEDPYEAVLDAAKDYLRAGLYGEAWRVSNDFRANYDLNADFLELEGDILVSMRRYRDAVESYAAALEEDESRANIYEKLGDLYVFKSAHADRVGQAIGLYKEAIKKHSSIDEQGRIRLKIDALERGSS